MRKLNNKGFTLIEVLAVLVILVAIMGIAIPTITSSMERTKEKQNNAKKEMLASYAEEYVEDYKNDIYKVLVDGVNSCAIPISELKENGYLADGAELDIDGNEFNGYIIFDKTNNSYSYEKVTGLIECRKVEKATVSIENINRYFVFVDYDNICYDESNWRFVFSDISEEKEDIIYTANPDFYQQISKINGHYFCLMGNEININTITHQNFASINICDNGRLYKVVSSNFSSPLLTLNVQLTNYSEGNFNKCS